MCFCVNAEKSVRRPAAGFCPWPCPFENLSISYSDDNNLVGRAGAIDNQNSE